jgi:hypothetical protein
MSRAQDPVPQETSAPWFVLIEETLGPRWVLSQILPFPDRATALAHAATAARTYRPTNPRMKYGRTVFRTGEDLWTVQVEGGYTRFHFRVSLAQQEYV